MNWTIRPGGGEHAQACMAVYVDAVRNGTARHYTREQAMAWASSETVEPWLPPRLEAGKTWVAWSQDRAEGFVTITPEGHLDFFFVRPSARESGLAAALYDRMIHWANAEEFSHLTTYASHLARSFLEKRGWRMLEGESTIRHGTSLKRWKMETTLPKQ